MKNFWLTTLSLVLAGAVTANVGMLFNFGERLTRIETKLELLANQPHIAKNP